VGPEDAPDLAPEVSTVWTACHPAGAPVAGQCPGVDQLVISNPSLRSGDGGAASSLAPGSTAVVTVVLSDPTSVPFIDYPVVCFESGTPGITFGEPNPVAKVYGIAPGMTATFAIPILVDPSVPPATTAHLRAAALGTNGRCGMTGWFGWDVAVQ